MRSLFLLIYSSVLLTSALFSQGSGNTLKFNGNSQFIDVGDQVANGCRTIELWFKLDVDITPALSSPKSLVIRDFNNASGQNTDEFGLYFAPNNWQGGINAGRVVFMRRVGTNLIQIGSDNDFWEAGHWYHVCGTIDPVNGMQLYVNGILQQTTHPSTNPIGTQAGAASDKVSIGRWGNINIRYFDGEIDEVRFWDTERSQQQIRDKMCSSLSGTEPGLRAYWNFDSASGTTLIDNSTNNFSGSLQSMNNSNWIYSGAPIGDTSTYFYAGNLTGSATNLSTGIGDVLTVDNINSTAQGVQLYKVNSLPNVTTGLNTPTTGNYYGVFLTSTNGTYNVSYDYDAYSCSSCDEIFGRNDNAELNWTFVSASSQNCAFGLQNESSVGFDYRSEYIIHSTGFTAPNDVLGNDTVLCSGAFLVLDPQIPNSTFLWQDNSTGPTYTVSQSGMYSVQITNSCGTFTDSINITYASPPVVNLGNDTLVCQNAPFLLDPGLANMNFVWQDNSSSPTYSVTQTGVYSVTASNACGSDSDTIEIIYQEVPTVSLGADTSLCEGESLLLDITTQAGNYLWQDGSNTSNYLVTQSGLYWVELSNLCGNSRDSINVDFIPLPVFELGSDTSFCEGGSLLLDPNVSTGTVLWQDGSTSPTFNVLLSGVYSAAVTVNNCTYSDTLNITVLSSPAVDLGGDVAICEGENFLLSPVLATGSPAWSTGSSEANIIVNSFGQYSLTVTNQCGTAADTIFVTDLDCSCTYYVPNSFTPNGGKHNELFGMVYDCDLSEFEFTIYNRWGEAIFETINPDVLWDGTYQNKHVQTGVYSYKIKFVNDKGIGKMLIGHVNLLY